MGSEAERKPNVFVNARGMLHAGLNATGGKDNAFSFRDNIRKSRGEHILYFEAAYFTPEYAVEINGDMSKYGFAMISARSALTQPGGTVSVAEARARANRLAVSDLPTIVSKSLLPLKELFHYYQDLELDAIRAKNKLTIEHENHPYDRARQIVDLREQQLVYFDQSKDNWTQGKFEEVPVMYQRYDELIDRQSRLREGDIEPQLATLLDRLMASRVGGTLDILIGGEHLFRLVPHIASIASPHSQVHVFDNREDFEEEPMVKLHTATSGNMATELDVIRAFMSDHLAGLIDKTANSKLSLVAGIAMHYPDISKAVRDLINSMSLDDLRRLCESQEDALQFFVRQPAAFGVAKFLT